MREGESDVKANSISDLYLEPISLSLFNGKKKISMWKKYPKNESQSVGWFSSKKYIVMYCVII